MNDKLLERIGKLIENNTALLRKEMQQVKTVLKEAIERSQEDTIEALSDVANNGYYLHDKRIKRIEEHLHLPQTQ